MDFYLRLSGYNVGPWNCIFGSMDLYLRVNWEYTGQTHCFRGSNYSTRLIANSISGSMDSIYGSIDTKRVNVILSPGQWLPLGSMKLYPSSLRYLPWVNKLNPLSQNGTNIMLKSKLYTGQLSLYPRVNGDCRGGSVDLYLRVNEDCIHGSIRLYSQVHGYHTGQ